MTDNPSHVRSKTCVNVSRWTETAEPIWLISYYDIGKIILKSWAQFDHTWKDINRVMVSSAICDTFNMNKWLEINKRSVIRKRKTTIAHIYVLWTTGLKLERAKHGSAPSLTGPCPLSSPASIQPSNVERCPWLCVWRCLNLNFLPASI